MIWLGGMAAAAVLFGTAAAAAEAPAQETAQTADDLHCALVGIALTGHGDPEVQRTGALLAYYFYGRLSALGADFDVPRRLTVEAQRVGDELLSKDGDRCLAEFDKVIQSVNRIGTAETR